MTPSSDTAPASQGTSPRAEERALWVVENGFDLVCELDADGRFVYVNRNFERILGHAAAHLVGEIAFRYVHPDDLVNVFRNARAERLATFRVRTAEGGWRWFEANGIRLRADGGVVGGIVVLRDIHEHRHVEAEMRRQAEEADVLSQTALGVVQQVGREALLDAILSRLTGLLRTEDGFVLVASSRQNPDTRWAIGTGFFRSVVPVQAWSAAGAAGGVWQSGRPLICNGDIAWPRREVDAGDRPRSGLIVPIFAGTEPIGVLGVARHDAQRRFDEADIGRVSRFAQIVSLAVERVGNGDDRPRETALRRYAERLEILRDIDSGILQAMSPRELAAATLPRVRRVIPSRKAQVWLYDAESETVESLGVATDTPDPYPPGSRVPASSLNLGHALQGFHIEQIDDLSAIENKSAALEELCATGIRSTLGAPLLVGARFLGVINVLSDRPAAFTDEHREVLHEIADRLALAIHNAQLREEIEEAYFQTVVALATAVDARDAHTSDHSQRMGNLAVDVARALGLSAEDLDAIRWGALLHDIGKIGIPDHVLTKPGLLTEGERTIMFQHPEIGAGILRPVKRLARVVPIVLHHQERWDGTGYPGRLRGAEIPIGARIIAVVDAYCSMTESRLYRPAMNAAAAISEIRRCGGVQFDPLVVNTFLDVLARTENAKR